VLAVHKLSSIGFVVLLSIIIYQPLKYGGLQIWLYLLFAIAAISIIALFVSGGMLSLDKYHEVMLAIHRISTLSFVVSCVIALFSFIIANTRTNIHN